MTDHGAGRAEFPGDGVRITESGGPAEFGPAVVGGPAAAGGAALGSGAVAASGGAPAAVGGAALAGGVALGSGAVATSGGAPASTGNGVPVAEPVAPLLPSVDDMTAEITQDSRHEYYLIRATLVAVVVIAIAVSLRLVFA